MPALLESNSYSQLHNKTFFARKILLNSRAIGKRNRPSNDLPFSEQPKETVVEN
jgi:hypothetical protein